MARPRKHDTKLPAYVRIRFGSYLYKDKKLCRVDEGEARMYEELAKRKALGDTMVVPAAVAEFKAEYLPTLALSNRDSSEYWLDLFAREFSDFRLDEVTAPDIKQSMKNLFLGTGKINSAGKYKARISTFFRWCVSDKGYVKDNPCREIWVEAPKSKKTPWTAELFWKMHDQLSPMLQCYHELSFLLYQRTTDVRLLLKSQVAGEFIVVEPGKTARSSGASVAIPVTPAIRNVLTRADTVSRTLGKKRGFISPYVIHARNGDRYTASGIRQAYEDAEVALFGERKHHLTPKALLPFAVTEAKKQGHTLEQLKVGRAHRNVATTEGYIQHHDTPVSEVMLTLPRKP
jgi:hypothetical protein